MKELNIKFVNDEVRGMYKDLRQTSGSAGFDVFVSRTIRFSPGETLLVPTGIKCEPVDDRAYILMPRSSIYKTPLRMANSIGLIDADYRGEIKIPLTNTLEYGFTLPKGARLAQLVGFCIDPVKATFVDELSETERDEGGFGSTGGTIC